MPNHEFSSQTDIPYYPFLKSKEIFVGPYKVINYISPEENQKIIKSLSEQVNLNRFDHVVVNLKGGLFLFEQLAKLQKYEKDPIFIEIHRPKEAFGAIVVKDVPKEILFSKSLIIDDIYDTGGVMRYIMSKVSPKSEAAVLITKNGIDNQIKLPRIHIGARIDNVWVGGDGMDLGIPGEEETFRNYPGIVVNPDSLK